MSDKLLTRREMLVRGAGAAVAASAAAVGGFLLHDPKGDAGLRGLCDDDHRLRNYFAGIDFPGSNPRISVAVGRLEDRAGRLGDRLSVGHRGQQIEKMVEAAVSGLDPSQGMQRFIARGDVVLIKPNVGFDRSPQMGATTNPEVLRWIIRLCKQAGARRIIVADNPIEAPEACFARSKIMEVAQAEGAKVVLPSQTHFEQVVIRDHAPNASKGEALGRWPIFYTPLAEATKVIGVAPIKDHNLCSASMNLKNFYGLLGGRRNQFHQAIHNILSDLGMMMSPTLVIADATRVMMKNGPTGGRLSDVRPGGELGRPAIVASVDPVACDAWCYQHLLGRDPAKLAYLDLACRKIAAQIAAGMERLCEPDWQTYHRQGQLVITKV